MAFEDQPKDGGSVVEGDPFSKIKQEQSNPAPAPRDVNFMHTRDDVDTGVGAHHHTVGVGRNQAASGSHVHDGINSKKIGAGMGITITGAKGSNAALASLIAQLSRVIEITDSTTP